jgi:hypothetical protein
MAVVVSDPLHYVLPLRAVLPLSARRPCGPSLVPMPLLRPSALWRTRLRGSDCSLARDPAMGDRHIGAMNRSCDWLHQAQADLEQAGVSAAALAASVSDLEDRLRILDALYIPTRYPDRLPDGAPTDHFGRLQSEDARRHARSIVDAIAAALA